MQTQVVSSASSPAEAGLAAAAGAPPPPDGRRAPVDSTTRPHPKLLTYYAIASLVLGPFFWVVLVPHYFRYRSLRYRFDDEGVTMRWGVLFRKEISLTYARIQDIHLTSNVVERWLGLARIQVQTASGNAGAEMTIEGLVDHERIRDWLYSRMRGAREASGDARSSDRAAAVSGFPPADPDAAVHELTATLREVAIEMRQLRQVLESGVPRTEQVDHV